MKTLNSNPGGKFSTHIGFAEYGGCQHLYDGNFEETFRGTKEEVIDYLQSLISVLEGQDSLKWQGGNGSWYMGQAGIDVIKSEIADPIADDDEGE